jgi:hypothetical protein
MSSAPLWISVLAVLVALPLLDSASLFEKTEIRNSVWNAPDFSCHDPARLADSKTLIDAAKASTHRSQVRIRSIKSVLMRHYLLRNQIRHEWVQVADSDSAEHPLACFDPRVSADKFHNETAQKENGCWIYLERAKVLREFILRHVPDVYGTRWDAVNSSLPESRRVTMDRWFAEISRVMQFVALRSADAEEFLSNLKAKNFSLIEDDPTLTERSIVSASKRKRLLMAHAFADNERALQDLYEAATCIMPQLSELGVSGHGVRDHPRYG